MDQDLDLEIKPTYDWCIRAFSLVQDRLGLNIRFHHDEGQVEAGQIFLFNHFARFETIVPQYLIHRESGAYCRCIASGVFFRGNEAFARFLYGVGALPNDLPGLLPFLAAEILRGRKVIIFPEGGMIKDRRVIDAKGRYSIYSPKARERRKHHTGAAALALTLEVFKARILAVHAAGEVPRLERWVRALGLESVEALLEAARRPTLIVPANITFYPLRITENILLRLADMVAEGISPRFVEELVIEGNILFKNTDMDVRLGDPIDVTAPRRWWDHLILGAVFQQIQSLDDLFALAPGSDRWIERLVSVRLRRESLRLRDTYMRAMYAAVTVNLSHLASTLILTLLDRGLDEVEQDAFRRMLYLAIQTVRGEPGLHLHRALRAPVGYEGVIEGTCPGLEQFLDMAESAALVERTDERYRFLPKLVEEHGFNEVRLENPVLVYANEVAQISPVGKAVQRSIERARAIDDKDLARMLFDDELKDFEWNKRFFSAPLYEEINRQETATKSGAPYLLLPATRKALGVVLVHGFLASPAELREFGERLQAEGYPVIGVRLKGHGTSPWDLRGRSWEDWLQSVRRGYRIVSAFADRIALVGFSTGGALALLLASERPGRLAGVAAVSVPMKFQNRNLLFVPLVRGANRMVRWMSGSALDGPMVFRPNQSEHPDINYRNMPIHALHELRRVVDALKDRLPRVRCPVTLTQGTEDPVVDPKSAELIRARLGAQEATLHWTPSKRHGILNEDIGDTRERILGFLAGITPSVPAHAPRLITGRSKATAVEKHTYPWQAVYPQDLDWAAPLPARPLFAFLDDAVARFGDRPCLDFVGRTYSYRDVGRLVDRAVKGFCTLGVGKGVKVGLCLPNTPYLVVCYYAVLRAGGTVVNFNPLYAERELRYQVEDSETEIMVTLDLRQIYPKMAALLETTRLRRLVICPMSDVLPAVKGVLFSVLRRSELTDIADDPRHITFERLVDNAGGAGTAEIDPDEDVALLQYTGGTTGVPKGAMLTHANLAANTVQLTRWCPEMEMGQERMLCVLPLFHAFAMTVAMNLGIATGALLILVPRFDRDEILKTIERTRPTLMPAVPTLFTALLESPDIGKYDLSSIKFCISGGAPLSADLKRRFERLTGCEVVEGYGLSEASPVVTCNPIAGVAKEGSIGVPLPGTVVEIRASDGAGRSLRSGETGEICVRGPQVMTGYWRRPEETEAVLADGWLHTGDLGYMDDDGYVFLLDRITDLILSSGYNVYPRAVEEAIALHPDVADATVIGVPHSYRGECPKAFVRLRPGASLTAEDLKAFLRDKLSPMERPESIEFRDELPRTLIGKASKKDLRSEEETTAPETPADAAASAG